MALRTEFGRSRDSVMRQRILQGKQKARKDAERRAREVAEMSVEVNAELVRDTERRKAQKLARMQEEQAEKRRVEAEAARAEAELEALLAAKEKEREAEQREHARTVWIRGLPSTGCTEALLTHYMNSVGTVARASVCVNADDSWGLVTYAEHATAVKVCELAGRTELDGVHEPVSWPSDWRIEAVTKEKLSSLESQLLAETHEMSMETYRLSQDRNEHRTALRRLFVELEQQPMGIISGDEVQRLFAAMDLQNIPEEEKRRGGVVGVDAITVLTFDQLEHLWWECVNYKSHEALMKVLKDCNMALHPDDALSDIDNATTSLGERRLTKGPRASRSFHTTKHLLKRSASKDLSETERNLSRSTIRQLHATPMRVRSESLALLDTAIQQARAENARKQYYMTMSNARVATILRQKFRVRQDLGHTIRWAIKLQARWRMLKVRQEFRRIRRSTIIIQARWRGLRTRNHIQHALTDTAWHFISVNTVFVSNIIGALEEPGKLKASLTHALKRCSKISKVTKEAEVKESNSGRDTEMSPKRTPVVLNCEMRIRARPEASWALVTFGKPAARMMVLDPAREGWSDELSRMVAPGKTCGNDTEEVKGGIMFKEIAIDQAIVSTGAFGWTFKSAQKNVKKAVYKLQKAEELRQHKLEERRQSKMRLQRHAGQAYATNSMFAYANEGLSEREQQRTRARFAMERAQCLCPLSRLPMRWPVVAADGFIYERSAISRWLDQHGLFSPVTGAPLKNALLVKHQSLAAAAHELESSQSSSSLMHAYTAGLRASTMLGAARVDSQSPLSAAVAAEAAQSEHGHDGGNSRSTDGTAPRDCLWDGGTNANLLLVDTQAAQAALRHGVLLSKRRKDEQQHLQADFAAPPGQDPPTDHAATPTSPAQSQGNRVTHGLRHRRLRPASAPVARVDVDAKPNSIDGRHRSEGHRGYAGNHGSGGLGGGGGSSHHGMQFSQAEIVSFSPRFWPSTPTLVKSRTKGRTPRARTSSPAARMRAELTQEYQRQAKEAVRATQPGQRGPMNGLTVVGFGSGSEVSREPYFVPSVAMSDLAIQAATRQAAAVVKAVSSGSQLPQPPPCLWAPRTGRHDNANQGAIEGHQSEWKHNQDTDRAIDVVGARLLEEWHSANEREGH